jgi:putative DNA primase/helicase
VIEAYGPTLLIDEADNFAHFNDDLKGLLNASHEKMTAQAIRVVGDAHEPKTFSTWAAKVLTAIGSLPDTIEDRSIRIPMLRMPSGVKKDRARRKAIRAAATPLVRRCMRWASDNEVALRSIDEPDLDVGNDRASDNWGPLLTVAAICGDEVLRQAKEAAASLTGGEQAGNGELLLDHIRDVFGDDKERVGTTELLKALVDRDDGPWARFWASDVNDGDRIKKAAADLARRLRRFDPTLKASEKTVNGERSRGYERTQFEDLWRRYLPAQESHDEPEDDAAAGPGDLEHLAQLEHGDPETRPLTSGDVGGRKVRKVREDSDEGALYSPEPTRAFDYLLDEFDGREQSSRTTS